MSKSMNMLRTRRRDNNVKPNRRLDRKSSRGMIYENEELRLKTININAEIERGQSDIKKLRRENEMLKKEIWYLRDEYEKLDKLLKQKEEDFSSSSTWSSDSEASCSGDSKEVETSQNLENVQKTNLKNLQAEFDHLSVVPEEPSTENSDKSHASANDLHADLDSHNPDPSGSHLQLPPDQEYPLPMPKHFFAPLPKLTVLPQRPLTPPDIPHFYTFRNDASTSMMTNTKLLGPGIPGPSMVNKPVDLIVKTDNTQFNPEGLAGMQLESLPKLDPMQMLEVEHLQNQRRFEQLPTASLHSVSQLGDQFNEGSFPRSSFSNGGNLEELLNDIQTISEDILKISHPHIESLDAEHPPSGLERPAEPFPNGEIRTYQPGHYPLEKSSFNGNVQSLDRLAGLGSEEVLESKAKDLSNLDKYKSEISVVLMPTPMPLIGLEKYKNLSTDRINFPSVRNCEDIGRLQLEGQSSSDQLTSDIEVIDKDSKVSGVKEVPKGEVSSDGRSARKGDKKEEKSSIRRKVSIHFKGRKDKTKSTEDDKDDSKPATTKLTKPPSLTISSTPSSHTLENLTSTNPTSGGLSPQPSSTPILLRAATPCHSPPPQPTLPSILSNSQGPIPKDSSDSEHLICKPHNSHSGHNKSTSASPDRHDSSKKHHKHKKKKKTSAMSAYLKSRRNTPSTDHLPRERSVSVCTDRGPYLTDDCQMSSERERTNSLSSCGTNAERIKRKFSTISRIPSGTGGKIPWCACWGNGCV